MQQIMKWMISTSKNASLGLWVHVPPLGWDMMLYTPCHCTMIVVFIVKKRKGKVIDHFSVQWCLGNEGNLLHILCLLVAVELKVRNWTKFNVRAACRPLESGQWIQTLAPDVPPTANSTATVRMTCNYRTGVCHIWYRTMRSPEMTFS